MRDYVGELRTFREWFDGTLLHVPGMHVGIRTTEGTSAVDEAIGGFCVVDVRSREEALEWAAKTAGACRCAQEVREFMPDPAVGN